LRLFGSFHNFSVCNKSGDRVSRFTNLTIFMFVFQTTPTQSWDSIFHHYLFQIPTFFSQLLAHCHSPVYNPKKRHWKHNTCMKEKRIKKHCWSCVSKKNRNGIFFSCKKYKFATISFTLCAPQFQKCMRVYQQEQ
jgi:hypothetical protein